MLRPSYTTTPLVELDCGMCSRPPQRSLGGPAGKPDDITVVVAHVADGDGGTEYSGRYNRQVQAGVVDNMEVGTYLGREVEF